ncbi:Trimethyllysine dioxygenase [Grifola frondosa]|uniref:Trimethyllysine dioxygenase n=1 Tax=Grifola frondosa TaxID=5627 RepID=A0A1C7M5R6_GRIFR|nr:Trimethyllysine dioxygenase [Grifola frondosa]
MVLRRSAITSGYETTAAVPNVSIPSRSNVCSTPSNTMFRAVVATAHLLLPMVMAAPELVRPATNAAPDYRVRTMLHCILILRSFASQENPLGVEDPAGSATITYEEAMAADDRGVFKWLSNIARSHLSASGSASCPVSRLRLKRPRSLSRRIGFIRETQYGTFWDFTSDLAKGDTAYYDPRAWRAHRHYLLHGPVRTAAFHLLSHTDGTGGATLLVDGFYVASLLQELHPDAYALLSQVPVPAHAAGEPGALYVPNTRKGTPILRHEDGELVQVRWNNDDRSVMRALEPGTVEGWYDAIRVWYKSLTSADSEYWVQLSPGTVVGTSLAFTVVLLSALTRLGSGGQPPRASGRSAFDGARRMCGHISAWTSNRSRLAVLTERFAPDAVVRATAPYASVNGRNYGSTFALNLRARVVALARLIPILVLYIMHLAIEMVVLGRAGCAEFDFVVPGMLLKTRRYYDGFYAAESAGVQDCIAGRSWLVLCPELCVGLRRDLIYHAGVGKTSLAIRYVFDLYSDYWDPTGEEPYRKIATVDEERLLVEVLDISGEHPCDRDSIMLNRAYGVMFVYSVSSRRSFERISELHGEAVRLREQENFPMIVVANKCEFDGTSREVSAAEGQKLADSLSCEFIETSCSRDMNVQEAFATLLHAMIINQKICIRRRIYSAFFCVTFITTLRLAYRNVCTALDLSWQRSPVGKVWIQPPTLNEHCRMHKGLEKLMSQPPQYRHNAREHFPILY